MPKNKTNTIPIKGTVVETILNRFDKSNLGCCNAGECYGDHNAELKAFLKQALKTVQEETREEMFHKMHSKKVCCKLCQKSMWERATKENK